MLKEEMGAKEEKLTDLNYTQICFFQLIASSKSQLLKLKI